jgi:hypothetical protein
VVRSWQRILNTRWDSYPIAVHLGLGCLLSRDACEPRQNENSYFVMKSFSIVLYYKYYNLIL